MTDSEKIKRIKQVVELAKEWSDDQENGMTPHEVCLAAMKDIRRVVNDDT